MDEQSDCSGGEHADSFAGKTSHSKRDEVSNFETHNSEATDNIIISFSSSGPEELKLELSLLVAMAEESWSQLEYDESDDQNVDAIFDEALCDVAKLALQTAELNLQALELHKVRALLIQVARDIDSYSDLHEHLAQYDDDEIEQFGLKNCYEKSTYRKAAKRLEESGQSEGLINAALIAVYGLFRNGVPLPSTVQDRYDLSYDMGPAASDFPEEVRHLALYTLVSDLLDIVNEHLDFHRSNNASKDIATVPGIFAFTADHDRSIEEYRVKAAHTYDLSSALHGSTVRSHIDRLSLSHVESMFRDINQELLNYVIKSGVVSEPVLVSYDLTDMQSLNITAFNEMFLTKDGRWRFSMLSFTDPDLEFAFGTKILNEEAQRDDFLENFLQDLTSIVDIRLLMLDRGFDGSNDVEACRLIPDDSWIICAQDDSEDHGPKNDYAHLRHKLEPGGSAVIEPAGFENLHPPTKMIGYSGASEVSDTVDPVRAFFTDLSLPSDEEKREELIKEINFLYNQRAKIENIFSMAKNNFDVYSDTDDPVRKIFYFNTSILFCNLFKIVNTVPSPKRGLTFDIDQQELLEVIMNISFGGPDPSDGFDYSQKDS